MHQDRRALISSGAERGGKKQETGAPFLLPFLVAVSTVLLAGCLQQPPEDVGHFYMDAVFRRNLVAVEYVCKEKREDARRRMEQQFAVEEAKGVGWVNTKGLKTELVEHSGNGALLHMHGVVALHWRHGRVDNEAVNALYSLTRNSAGAWRICY